MYSQKEYNKHIQKVDNNYIRNNLEEFTSNVDFKNYFGFFINDRIISYSELKNYKTLTSLLPKNGSFKILLYEQRRNTGHWVLLLRYDDIVEYFDSYGNPPNYPLTYSETMNSQLDQRYEYLHNLFSDQSEFNIVYNKYKFQSDLNDAATCGKHVLLRLIKFKYSDLDLPSYIEYFKRLARKYKLTNDELVTLLIPVGKD